MRLNLFALAFALGLTACPMAPSSDVDAGSGGGGGGGGTIEDGGSASDFGISAKGVVRFKRSERLTVDFGNALGLPYDVLCKELGLYSCSLFVHPLALGGVDPYVSGLYEPLPFTGVTSPIVVDRVALAGCSQRVKADLATPATAVIFKGVTVVDGKVDASSAAAKTAIDTLYKRAIQRAPTESEVAHLVQLNADIVVSGKPEPGKAWLTLSCFAVLTSVESLFY